MSSITLSEMERLLGIDPKDYEGTDVDSLEAFIEACNVAAADYDGEPLVEDAIYDRLVEILREVKPSSNLLSHLWDDVDDNSTELDPVLDQWLLNHPMLSIQTVKSWNDKFFTEFYSNALDFKESEGGVSLFFASKINGHGVRVVYRDGYLVKATSRARASKGRNITRQLKNILGEFNENLPKGIVEIRGEVCLHTSRMPEAREFNPDIKSAFSAVSSLLKPSSTLEENQLLDFLAYKVYREGYLDIDSIEEEYQELEEYGFDVPSYVLLEVAEDEDVLESIEDVFNTFEENYDEYGYFCDGVVLAIDSKELYEGLGTEGPRNKGNIALKVGKWEQNFYSGYVQKIEWTEGKSKFSPVAVVSVGLNDAEFDEDGFILNHKALGVPTAQGNTVRNVPLYEPKNILILEAYPGRVLHFRYGGEAGVVPCDEVGNLLKDSAVSAVVTGE